MSLKSRHQNTFLVVAFFAFFVAFFTRPLSFVIYHVARAILKAHQIISYLDLLERDGHQGHLKFIVKRKALNFIDTKLPSHSMFDSTQDITSIYQVAFNPLLLFQSALHLLHFTRFFFS